MMKRIHLPPGRHVFPEPFSEPTELYAEVIYGWPVEIVCDTDAQHTLHSTCNLRVVGCGIGYARDTGVKVYGTSNWCELDSCWVHNNNRHGVNVNGTLRIHRCLVERNGVASEVHNGVYCGTGKTLISNSIIRHNAGYQVSAPITPYQSIRLDQCVVRGNDTLWATNCEGKMNIRRCTLHGSHNLKTGDLSSGDWQGFDDCLDVGEAPDRFVGLKERLHWLSIEQSPARGAYDYDATLTKEFAEECWPRGHMEAYAGWGCEANRFKFPHFPGDPVPVPEEI